MPAYLTKFLNITKLGGYILLFSLITGAWKRLFPRTAAGLYNPGSLSGNYCRDPRSLCPVPAVLRPLSRSRAAVQLRRYLYAHADPLCISHELPPSAPLPAGQNADHADKRTAKPIADPSVLKTAQLLYRRLTPPRNRPLSQERVHPQPLCSWTAPPAEKAPDGFCLQYRSRTE